MPALRTLLPLTPAGRATLCAAAAVFAALALVAWTSPHAVASSVTCAAVVR